MHAARRCPELVELATKLVAQGHGAVTMAATTTNRPPCTALGRCLLLRRVAGGVVAAATARWVAGRAWQVRDVAAAALAALSATARLAAARVAAALSTGVAATVAGHGLSPVPVFS